MSLRALVRGSAVVLGTLVFLTAGTLIAITSYLDSLASGMRGNLESVRAGEEIQLNLLWHSRAALVGEMAADVQYARREAQARSQADRWLEVAYGHVSDPEEQLLVEHLAGQIEGYFEEHDRRRMAGIEHLQIYAQTASLLAAASDTAERLVQINLSQAEAARDTAAYWDSLANAIGISLSVLLLLAGAAVLLGSEKQIYGPLLAIRIAIARFMKGDREIVAPERGVLELREIAHAFNQMVATIERQREGQLNFIAGVAHDLRNPLGAMNLAIHLIPPHEPNASAERIQSTIDLIARQIEVLTRMISDLLDASRIQAGRFEIRRQPTDLRDLLSHAVDLFRISSTRHQLVTRVPPHPAHVSCDPDRIEQVLNNLVSNAIKYSPAGGTVEASIEVAEDRATISIRDEGIGIPESEQDLIFEPFRRSDLMEATIPGVGLGLSVAQRILAAHGSKLRVHSVPGCGSTFSFDLPL